MENDHQGIILFRAFVSVGDVSAATGVSRSIDQALSQHGQLVRSDPPTQYWKIPEYWEVFIALRPAKSVETTFELILGQSAHGWDTHRFKEGGSWAVWNSTPGSSFLADEVCWAEVQCVSEADFLRVLKPES